MRDFMILMHDDATSEPSSDLWRTWFSSLRDSQRFDGGSSIGMGETYRKLGVPGHASSHLTGFVRVRAESLGEARRFLAGNPVFECGGTVEIRELPRD
ncbi:MAG: hypothetical protein V4472_28165 [Pseudomonadota bacterium]